MKADIPAKLLAQLDDSPKKPGVYIFKDDKSTKLYIGKAVNLWNRSRSYFLNYKRLDPRLQTMVDRATQVEYLPVDNEVEALLLETNLIKKYSPRFNVMMMDDKSYIWVKIHSGMDFPLVQIVREKKDDKADYFGPYPAVKPIKRLLKKIRRMFSYRSCKRVIEEREQDGATFIYSSNPKPCLYYHIGLCSAPCNTQLSKREYRSQINSLKRFLRNEHAQLLAELEKKMQKLSTKKDYEKAAEVRDQIKDIKYLTQYSIVDETVDDVTIKERQEERMQVGLAELLDKLGVDYQEDDLADFRIECYDISNIQGTNATAAMVVSKGGKLQKNLYRKFKIKSKSTPDDYAMLQETLGRRLKYLQEDQPPAKVNSNAKANESFSEWPGLLVIDGGKGQLSSVLEILQGFSGAIAEIPVVGLAKREEIIFLPGGDSVRLSRRSSALHIVQQLRDEAHRFGLGYHRTLRSKGMLVSPLDDIPGVGETTKKRLLQAFGSLKGIKRASLTDLESVVRNKTTTGNLKKLL